MNQSLRHRYNFTEYNDYDLCDYDEKVFEKKVLKFVLNFVILGLMSLFGIFGNLLTVKTIGSKESSIKAKAFHIFMKVLCINDAILLADSMVIFSLPHIEE